MPQRIGLLTLFAVVLCARGIPSLSAQPTPPAPPAPLDLTVTGDPNARDSRTGRTPLHVAAMANSPGLIATLVAAGADVEARDEDDLTPLHVAALAGPAAIAALVEAGADLHARNRFGESPLQYASFWGSGDSGATGTVAALLEAGADPNLHDSITGRTALHRTAWAAGASGSRGEAMAKQAALLAAGADPNARTDTELTPLHFAAMASSLASTEALLAAGADPHARDAKGKTPLWFWVATSDNTAVMAALLEAGADIETRDAAGGPLLHLAAARDRPEIIDALLEAGADLNVRDSSGRTPLHVAAGYSDIGAPVAAAAAIAALLEAGMDPDARDNSGRTALQLAPADSVALMTALLDAHAGRTVRNANARDWFGSTALHAAARANNPELITALVEAGANVDALDLDGHTPLLVATGAIRMYVCDNVPHQTFNAAAITALAAAGADLEARNSYGQTSLHLAAYWDRTAVIPTLVEAGADLAAPTVNGSTALHIALGRGYMATIALLAEAGANLEGGDHNEFAAVVALAAGNPEALSDSALDLNARDHEGRTVMHWLAAWPEPAGMAALAALAEAGANLGARDNRGWTPLHQAAYRRNAVMITALAQAGADLDVRNRFGAALHVAVIWGNSATVAALAAAGADLEVHDSNGWTALHLAAHRGQPVTVAALVEGGANLEARDVSGLTALHLAASRDNPLLVGHDSTLAAVAALLDAGAALNALDHDGNTPLYASAMAGNQAGTTILLAFGANWTSSSGTDLVAVNARTVAVELFQGPMTWQWILDEPQAAGSGMRKGSMTDHTKTLLRRATTVAVRIGSEMPEPMPELSVSLSDAGGRSWAAQADLVQGPDVVSVPGSSESGLWEIEYVYELPADWAESGHRASFAIDPYNRLEETDENDNTATLTMDGYAVPVFDVTFVPIVFSGEPLHVDTDMYMAVMGDLVPIGEYRAQVGRPLDLSGRNLDSIDKRSSVGTALNELLHRWNAEAGENEYYHGLVSTAALTVFGFGGQAVLSGNVAVSDAISDLCQEQRTFCGKGVHAHELGHNLGLSHAAGSCSEPEPFDRDYPYPGARIGPRRGWVASRDEFVTPGEDNRYRDLMGYCKPRFVSDYHYDKMVDYRLGSDQAPSGASGRLGPSFEIGPNPSVASSMASESAPSPAYASPAGASASSGGSGPGVAFADVVDEIGPSLAFTGAVDEYGLWSTFWIDASTQPPRPANAAGDYFFTLQDAFQREIYREPMTLLTATHGEASRSWAVRVPVPEATPVFLAILDAQGTPLYIEPIEMPDDVALVN